MATLMVSLAVQAAMTEPAESQVFGPEPMSSGRDRSTLAREFLVHRGVGPPPLRDPPTPERLRREALLGERPVEEPETIERVSGETKGPRIPEPMVFDLVRPLGAKRGEAEANVLGLIPLRRKARTVDDAADPLGLVRRSPDRQGVEWAPEIEWAVSDGVALEVELPMENGRLEAYKAAGQVTFGTAFGHRFIHGAQTIVQYDRDPALWTTTWLYLAGLRFSDTWSLFGMFGPRFEMGHAPKGANTEMLANLTLFADVTTRLVAGVETNYAQVVTGQATVLVMPQVHYEVSKYWMLQGGVGVRVTRDLTIPELGFRLIREF